MNMGKMMKQARQMQDKMAKVTENLEVEGSAGGGMVKVKMNGNKQLLDIIIDAEVVDPEDVEMLQDMIMAAVNDATRKADEEMNNAMGGMMPPGMQGML
jgi:DNA-binding YbaB/EbfC family protein